MVGLEERLADLEEMGMNEDSVKSWDEERRYLIERNNKIAAETAATRLGMERGEARGIREGREEGILEGIRRGKLEGKLETALGMLREGIVLPLVARCTGLPEREILRLVEGDLER